MALGQYRMPGELKDEDKWLRFFTKTQLVVLVITLIVSVQLVVLTAKLGLLPLGIFIFIVNITIAAVAVMIKMPEDKYLFGAGLTLGVILLRVITKMLFKKKLYVRGYDDSEDKEE